MARQFAWLLKSSRCKRQENSSNTRVNSNRDIWQLKNNSSQTILVAQNAGWGRFTSEQAVWLIKKGDQVTVFSSVCPHLGCTVNESANGFGCVCHNSSWTRDGETSGGPTPRGLDRLEHKVENGVL